MRKYISVFLVAALCFSLISCDKSIKAKVFTPQESYAYGTEFSLNLPDYFSNAGGAEFSSEIGTISQGMFTLALNTEGQIEVAVTATKKGKTAELSFTLNVVRSGEQTNSIQAKSFVPAQSYDLDTDFTLELKNYFINADGAQYQTDTGSIVNGVLIVELTQIGALPVTVTAQKSGKSATLSFTLNVTPIWKNAPTVTGVFYDDFSEGIDSQKWEVSSQRWGSGVGASPNNVFYSTDTAKAAAEGCESGGILAMRTFGDLKQETNLRRQGSLIVTREAFGPGKFEARVKVVPRLGQCTALWTYWNGGGKTIETNRYSEIDIEMPMNSDYRRWSGTTYKYFYDWTVLAERGTVTVDKEDGVNDGQWHTWGFEWRTDDENGDNAVVWYLDGKKQFEIRGYTPEYTASFWIGNWYPEDLGWVGVPSFEEAYMYVDWVRITKYDDPVKTGLTRNNTSGGNAINLGSSPIPQNQYIANGEFKQVESGDYIGWEKTGTATGGGSNPIVLGANSRLTQMILAQYSGYSFDINVDGQITSGSGSLKVFAQYMFGSVAMGKSEELVINSQSPTQKSLNFTLPQSLKVTDIRIVLQTDAGTEAKINKISMYKR